MICRTEISKLCSNFDLEKISEHTDKAVHLSEAMSKKMADKNA
jgi:hypothetical protein